MHGEFYKETLAAKSLKKKCSRGVWVSMVFHRVVVTSILQFTVTSNPISGRKFFTTWSTVWLLSIADTVIIIGTVVWTLKESFQPLTILLEQPQCRPVCHQDSAQTRIFPKPEIWNNNCYRSHRGVIEYLHILGSLLKYYCHLVCFVSEAIWQKSRKACVCSLCILNLSLIDILMGYASWPVM